MRSWWPFCPRQGQRHVTHVAKESQPKVLQLSEPGPANCSGHLHTLIRQMKPPELESTVLVNFESGVQRRHLAPGTPPCTSAGSHLCPCHCPCNLSPHQHQPLPQSGTPCPAHPPRHTPPGQLHLIKMRKEFAFSFQCTPSNHTSSSNFENFVPLLIISLILHFKAQRQPISLVGY